MTVFHEFSEIERDSVLAGLRLLQLFNAGELVLPRNPDGTHKGDDIIAVRGDSGESLTNDEIDDLIEELNW